MQVRIILIAILFALTQLSGPRIPKWKTAGPKPSAVKTRTIRTIRGSTGAEINTPDPPLIEPPRLVPLHPPEIDMPRPLFFHPTFVATGKVLLTPEVEDAPGS
jgi:hypothetical protein